MIYISKKEAKNLYIKSVNFYKADKYHFKNKIVRVILLQILFTTPKSKTYYYENFYINKNKLEWSRI